MRVRPAGEQSCRSESPRGWPDRRSFEDTNLTCETIGRRLDNIAVARSGSAAERVRLGEHTSGGESDNETAVMLCMKWVKAGFAGPGILLGEDGLAPGYLTDEVKTKTLVRIAESRARPRSEPPR